MSFLYPTIISIGLPLLAVPLLVHLLNLRRQQRIRWAAMQFLEESQRRNRTSVLLRQLLLLLARTAAIGLLVLMLAQPVLRGAWARFFAGSETHHVVLVDDSYSMSDHDNDTDVMEQAKRVTRAIVQQAYHQGNSPRLTLLTFTEAASLTAGAEPALYDESIDDAFRSRLETALAKLTVTQTDVGPLDGLRGVNRLARPAGDQTQVLHVLSDFRARHFREANEFRDVLDDLAKDFEHTHLVQCVRKQRANLAISSLVAESGLRAAGVESWVNLTVANFSDQTAHNVTVRLNQDGAALPAVVIKQIPPGDRATHRFRTRFEGTGAHWLEASLEVDAVQADNRRWLACDLKTAVPVLIVDGSQSGRDAYYLATALRPGGATRTGWQPRVERVEFLRDAADLSEFAAVCLLDVSRLDQSAVASLERYAEQGGGIAYFLGENADRPFYNRQLYQEGTGLFPAPLELPTQLLDRHEKDVPDLAVSNHSLFRALAGERNSFLPLMKIDYYYAVPEGWKPVAELESKVLARLRNGAPLVIEHRFGKGRIVTHLTKLSPAPTALGPWSNWSINPVFPILANELVGYLAAGRDDQPLHQIGDDLVVSVPEDDYRPEFRFLLPGDGPGKEDLPVEASAMDGILTARIEDVSTSGVYEVRVPAKQGDDQRRAYAVNVEPQEGDLAILTRQEIDQSLAGAEYEFHYADQLQATDQRIAGFQVSNTLLGALVAVLILEQLLAYSASYHGKLQTAK